MPNKICIACPICACIICVNDENKGNRKPGNLHSCVQEYAMSAKFKMEKEVPFDITFVTSQQV